MSNELEEEARYLAHFLFTRPLSQTLLRRYVEAHQHGAVTTTGAAVDLAKMRSLQLDAGAIELALRRREPLNLLTQKMQVLVYLAEAQREFYDDFVLEADRPITALTRMGVGTLRSVFKFGLGLYLVRAHRLV